MNPKCPNCHSTQIRIVFTRTYKNKEWSLAECDGCRLSFTSPCPTDQDIAGFYEGDYHGELRETAATEQAFETKYRRYVQKVKKFVHTGATLDVGCATGYLVKLFKEEGFQAQGIELNRNSVEWGSNHYGVKLDCTTLDDPALPVNNFALISMTDVLEHMVNPLETLERVRQLLRPDGVALITFPNIASLQSRYYRFLSRLLRRDWIWITCHVPLHTWEFTPETARAMFTRAGFEVVDYGSSHLIEELEGPWRLLSLPLHLTSLFPVGSQMEFVIRKTQAA